MGGWVVRLLGPCKENVGIAELDGKGWMIY